MQDIVIKLGINYSLDVINKFNYSMFLESELISLKFLKINYRDLLVFI